MLRAQALLPLLARHAGSYLELSAAAATECRSAWARRMTLVFAAATTGVAGLAALWGAGLVALWNSSWRLGYLALSALLLLAIAVWALRRALTPRSAGPASVILKSELQKDMELFQQWKNTL